VIRAALESWACAYSVTGRQERYAPFGVFFVLIALAPDVIEAALDKPDIRVSSTEPFNVSRRSNARDKFVLEFRFESASLFTKHAAVLTREINTQTRLIPDETSCAVP